MKSERIRLWDLPTRIFHWSLVLCVLAAIITGKLGGNAMVWHGRIGLVIVGLITFRLVWGLNGPTYARFAQFLPTPRRVFAYLGGHSVFYIELPSGMVVQAVMTNAERRGTRPTWGDQVFVHWENDSGVVLRS